MGIALIHVYSLETHLFKLGVDKRCPAVLRGVSHEGRFVGGGARNQELDSDIRRRDNDLDRFGSSDRRNTLRPVSLLYCIEYEMYVDVD